MNDSLFTKIIKGEIPCHKIYEDDKTIAFLDVHPQTPGHTLVVPKVQVDHIWDLDDETYQALMHTVKKLGAHMREKLRCDYVGVKVIGEQVPHAHVHLIPFNYAQEYAATKSLSFTPEEMSGIADELRME